jgi:hypothetical protein
MTRWITGSRFSYWVLGFVLGLCAGGGTAISICLQRDNNIAITGVQRVASQRPFFPPEHEVERLKVDMYLRLTPAEKGKQRYQLDMRRPVPGMSDKRIHDAFQTLLLCLYQSAPVTTCYCDHEPEGTIELILRRGGTMKLYILPPHYLLLLVHGEEHHCLVFDAWSFEFEVATLGSPATSELQKPVLPH